MAGLKRMIDYLSAFRFVWAFGIIWICMLNMPVSNAADDIVIYGANAYGFDEVIEINLTANTSQTVGDPLFDTQAIDRNPLNGRVYYVEWADTGDRLAYWDPLDGSNTLVRTYNPAPWSRAKRAAFGLDGFLYMMDTEDTLFRIDANSGDWEDLGQVQGIQHGSFYQGTGDIAFTPDGRLYLVTQKDLYEINTETMEATLLYSDMLPSCGWFCLSNVWTGLAFCDGSLYASDVEPRSNSSVFRIDLDTGGLTELIDTGTLINDLTSCPAMATEINLPPVLEPVGDREVAAGTPLQILLSATDPNIDDMLTFSAGELLPGATFDQLSGEFYWTPGEVGDSPYTVTFTVTDDGSPPMDDSETIVITVKEPCIGDYEPDGDVDGFDLLHLIAGDFDLNVNVGNFANCFGRSDCPTTAP
jgi:hypothetical protein